MHNSNTFIQALQNEAIYPHPITQFNVIQTHLSWVILTGQYAYKIKKPLNLGFQDFTTLEKRKYYCELEIILNKKLAPQIYLEVIPITGTWENPHLAGKGEPFEYAVKMNQFPQEALLSNLVKNGIKKETIVDIAKQIAAFHLTADLCSTHRLWGAPAEVFSPMQDNFQVLRQLPSSLPYTNEINQIALWAQICYQKLKPLLNRRKNDGFIRSCHGDLHLGNIVLLESKPVIFDCIEFNESFRWTDVMNDVSFLAMDLDHYHLFEFSHLFVNNYFDHTYDYKGAHLLKFYQCYRAMVRAKVTALQLNQMQEVDQSAPILKDDLKKLISLATRYTKIDKPTLIITFGVSGSGKTHYTEKLLMKNGAIRLRSDIIRKHMHGLDPHKATTEQQKEQIYSEKATKSLYYQLRTMAEDLLREDLSVIIDAACLKVWQRQLFADLALSLNVSFKILAFELPKEILQQRIRERAIENTDASDATLTILDTQLTTLDPLTEVEKSMAEVIGG